MNLYNIFEVFFIFKSINLFDSPNNKMRKIKVDFLSSLLT